MSSTRSALTIGGAVVAVALLVACHSRRPPAVLSPQGQTTQSTTGLADAPSDDASSLGGDDLQAVGTDGLSTEDFASAVLSEHAGPLQDIQFSFDDATLSDASRATLERHAAWLQTRRDTRALIEGHCDERGTVEYNLALGDKRAQAVRDYLISLGVAPERLTAVSLGKERPVDLGHDEAAWARNRRAHFSVSR
jgi:peptidoglycan-associated lipoprotein